jgi:hypothetical protein
MLIDKCADIAKIELGPREYLRGVSAVQESTALALELS